MAPMGPGGSVTSNIGGPGMGNVGGMPGPGGPHPPGSMMGPGGPGSQQGPQPPGPPGPPAGAAQSTQSNQQEQQRYDNVVKVRMLVGSLKDSLSEVVRVAAMNIYHTAAVDNGVRASSEGPPPRLDKALEEFYSICNQIELNLKTIQECVLQFRDSQQYLPIPVRYYFYTLACVSD